jgi:ubiquitin-activating enzyme E1
MIGAGALGCEYLKLFSMMGIAYNRDKKITVTDNDNIEVSNLNRQFLFKKEHLGKSKSKIACEEIKKMNKKFNYEVHQNLVNEDTENIYDENFWKSQNLIINAVDNIKARKYIDYNCTLFNKILIDSGTEGTKANSQLIIPHNTKSYNETHIGEAKENIAMCTLRLFPSNINHCIEWAKDKFNEYFFEDIKNLQNFIEKPIDYLNKIKDDEKKEEILNKMKILLEIKSENNIGKCIELGKNIFMKIFNHDIKDIISIFPEDYKNKDNTFFWSGSKKFPKIITIDKEKNYSKKFITYFTKILLNALKVKCRQYLNLNEFYDFHQYFTSKSKINLENKLLDLSRKVKINSINPEIFEKDVDSNNHINFIHACSNLRAKNYSIEECDKLKVKLIAGKIIPAVSSTTSAITGFTTSQIYTLIHSDDINIMKDIRFNIATNSYFILNPPEVVGHTDVQGLKKIIIAVPKNWTCWDHIEIQGPKTIRQFFEYVKDKYKIDVKGMFTFYKKCLIKNGEMLEYNIENAYALALGKDIEQLRRTLSFTINGKNENNNSVIMPVFIYRY